MSRFASNKEESGSEDLEFTTTDETSSSFFKNISSGDGTLGSELEGFSETADAASDEATDGGRLPAGDASVRTLEGFVPGVVLRAAVFELFAHVEHIFDDKTSRFEVLLNVGVRIERGETIAEFDSVTDTAVFFVGVVVVLGQNPFIADEARARLQDAEDFSEELDAVGGVAGGFNSVGTIDGGVSEGHLVEVTADVVREVIETEASIVALGTGDLVGIVVDTSDLSASEADHVAEGTADTTAEIDELVVVVPTGAEGEVVFVAFGGFFS